MRLADTFLRLAASGESVRVSAYDGSEAGPADAPVHVQLRSPDVLGYIATAPGSLGLARAYVAGALEIEGDMYTALRSVRPPSRSALPPGEWARVAGLLARHAVRRPKPPAGEARLRGRRHSRRRDAEAIAHHYDVSNRFYRWVLGPSMAYTCAVFPREDASLDEAQLEKFDLVARKLGLRPGMRLLDVGCGWGGMVLHAVERYGVTALGVTLSRQQADWAQQAIAEAGLTDRAEVRHLDYRDVIEGDFDAISSIGLTEHIGKRNLGDYVQFLLSKLRPGGRLLNHAIMRPRNTEAAFKRRGFINRYVFPDGELEALGHVTSVMQDTGFEVRHSENLREHYALTLAAWCANLDAHWEEAVQEVGEERARVWRLYMAGSRVGFEDNVIQLHQVLAVHPERGRAGMPLRPDWEATIRESVKIV